MLFHHAVLTCPSFKGTSSALQMSSAARSQVSRQGVSPLGMHFPFCTCLPHFLSPWVMGLHAVAFINDSDSCQGIWSTPACMHKQVLHISTYRQCLHDQQHADKVQEMNGAIESMGASGFSRGIKPTVRRTPLPQEPCRLLAYIFCDAQLAWFHCYMVAHKCFFCLACRHVHLAYWHLTWESFQTAQQVHIITFLCTCRQTMLKRCHSMPKPACATSGRHSAYISSGRYWQTASLPLQYVKMYASCSSQHNWACREDSNTLL